MTFVSTDFEIKENYCFKLHAVLPINFYVSTPLVIELEINCFNSISTGKLTQGVGLGSFPYKLLYKSQIELEEGFATNNGNLTSYANAKRK